MPIDFKLIADPSILAIESPSLDAVQYVSVRGSNANDGLSRGNPKRDYLAGVDSLPSGVNGQPSGNIVMGPGVFSSSIPLPLGYGTATTNNYVDGFSVRGSGRGRTILSYTGTDRAMEFANYTTVEQKAFLELSDFSLSAPNAAIGIDLKGSTYGDIRRVNIVGATSLGLVIPGSIGVKYDASYGFNIGCWWNELEHYRVAGFDTGVQGTGVAGAGQANENKFLNGRVALYTRAGIDIDEGDNCIIMGNDCTTTNLPSQAGIRLNGLANKALFNRFEGISTNGICILVDGAGTKPGDRCLILGNVFNCAVNSIAIKLAAGTSRTSIGQNQYSLSPLMIQVVDEGTAAAGSISVFGDALHQDLTRVRFALPMVLAPSTTYNLDPVGTAAGTQLDFIGYAYHMRGVMARLAGGTITAGSLVATPMIGGTPATFSTILTSGNANKAFQKMAVDTDSGNNGVGLQVVTDAGFATTAPVTVAGTVLIGAT